jgi:threonyl-tRNA synthetase
MKFDLTYVDSDGSKKTPVVLHRAILGSLDRTIAFYLEETKGNLPLWLAPNQVTVLPVNNEYHLEYAEEVFNELKKLGIRCRLNDSNEKLSYRMREEQIKKVPIMLVLGNNERDERTVTLRLHGNEQKNMSLEEFLSYVKEKNDSKALDL